MCALCDITEGPVFMGREFLEDAGRKNLHRRDVSHQRSSVTLWCKPSKVSYADGKLYTIKGINALLQPKTILHEPGSRFKTLFFFIIIIIIIIIIRVQIVILYIRKPTCEGRLTWDFTSEGEGEVG